MEKRLAAVTVCATLISAGAVLGPGSSVGAQKQSASYGAPATAKLSGTWQATVTRVSPAPGVPPTFRSLMTFTSDGGMLETSNTGTALRGPAHGAWIRTGKRRFSTSMVLFRFDPATGAFAGTQEINRTMVIAPDRMHFRAVSVARQLRPDGSEAVTGLRATEVGTRLVVTAIPDQP